MGRERRDMPVKRASGKHPSQRALATRQRVENRACVAVYDRVSSHNRTLRMQNRALREYATRRGWGHCDAGERSGLWRFTAADAGKVMEAARRRESTWYPCPRPQDPLRPLRQRRPHFLLRRPPFPPVRLLHRRRRQGLRPGSRHYCPHYPRAAPRPSPRYNPKPPIQQISLSPGILNPPRSLPMN
jgi:hypothetical protein